MMQITYDLALVHLQVIRDALLSGSGPGTKVARDIYDRALKERMGELLKTENLNLTTESMDKLGSSISDFAMSLSGSLRKAGVDPSSASAKTAIGQMIETGINVNAQGEFQVLNDQAINGVVESFKSNLLQNVVKDPSLLSRANSNLKTFANTHKGVTLGVSAVASLGGFYALYDSVARSERTDKTTGEVVKRGLAPRIIQGTLGTLAAAVGVLGSYHSVNAIRAR